MRARQRPAASPRVRVQPDVAHHREIDRRLPVPQLADVEVVLLTVEALAALPPEEHVADRLIHPLAAYDPLAVVVELAGAEVGLEHRRLRLFHLQDQRVLAAASDEQEHPRARADAADADDLARHLDEPIGLEQIAAVLVEARDVGVPAGHGRNRSPREDRPGRAARGTGPAAAGRCEIAARRRPPRSAA